jgi:3-phenylpropionate/trans-cinnamate dioxygenase ferredoxin reductase subunit
MLGNGVDHDVVPYFFSDISNWASLEYVGPAYEWDREVVRGSFEAGEFAVFYIEGGRVTGALSVGRAEDLAQARRWIASGPALGDRVDTLSDLSTNLDEL